MNKLFAILLLASCFPSMVKGQTVFNLDFETEIKPGFPAFWRTNNLFDTINYRHESSTAEKFDGRFSLKMSNAKEMTERPDFWGFRGASAFMDLSPALSFIKDTPLKVSIKLKTDAMVNGYANAYLTDFSERKWHSAKVSAPSDWTDLEIQLDKTTDLSKAYLVLEFNGKGAVYFDAIRITAGVRSLEDILPYPAISEETNNRLRDTISGVILTSLVARGNWVDKMLAANPRIIALGESTHGTSEFFEARSQIVKSIVLKKKKIVFAFETDMAISQRVNTYLNGGKEDIDKLLPLFGTHVWQVNELKETLKWIRSYNLTNPVNRVLFYGNDLAAFSAYRNVLNFCKTHLSSRDWKKIQKWLDPLRAYYTKYQYQSYAGVMKDSIDLSLQKNKDAGKYIQSKLNKLEKKGIIKDSLDWLVLNFQLIDQAISNKIDYAREKYMADNLFWINKNHPDHLIIWWAHTSHTGRYAGDTGGYLETELGNSYIPIGFYTAEGSYAAEPFGRTDKKLTRNNRLESAQPGTLEYILQKTQYPGMVMNVKDLSSAAWANWLNYPIMMRNIGSRPATGQFISGIPSQLWDYIVFINRTTGTTHISGK